MFKFYLKRKLKAVLDKPLPRLNLLIVLFLVFVIVYTLICITSISVTITLLKNKELKEYNGTIEKHLNVTGRNGDGYSYKFIVSDTGQNVKSLQFSHCILPNQVFIDYKWKQVKAKFISNMLVNLTDVNGSVIHGCSYNNIINNMKRYYLPNSIFILCLWVAFILLKIKYFCYVRNLKEDITEFKFKVFIRLLGCFSLVLIIIGGWMTPIILPNIPLYL